ncbi:MAG: TlpA family protein disulfide reductase [Fimbriimonadales bacterium]|nr:TlpA family protein disulfide reductase [Fimbriimonadales bacterium]
MTALAALALGAFVAFAPAPQQSLPTPEEYTQAWNHPLINAANKQTVKISDFKGKYKAIVIDAFASWCGPCQKIIPEVNQLHADYKDKGVLVIGLNVSDEWDDMMKNIQSASIQYMVLHDPKDDNEIIRPLKIAGIPTVLVLDGKTLEEKGRYVGANPNHKEAKMKVIASLGVEVN